MLHTDNTIQPFANLLVLPLRRVPAGRHSTRILWRILTLTLTLALRVPHLGERPRRPGSDGRAFGYRDDERRTAVEEVEDDGAAAGAARGAPHVCAVGGERGEEDEEAVGADVGGRGGVAEGEGVGGLGEEFVREEVVAWGLEGLVLRGLK